MKVYGTTSVVPALNAPRDKDVTTEMVCEKVWKAFLENANKNWTIWAKNAGYKNS